MTILPLLIVGLSVALALPLGNYLAHTFDRPAANAVERLLHCGPQEWKGYCLSLLGFNAIAFVVGFAVLATQESLPLNPDRKGALAATTVFHTAVSFFANNSQQHYSGEVHLSSLSQLVAIGWNMFVGGATGLCALAAVIRGLRGDESVGNFYLDLWRSVANILVPLSLVVALLLILCGVPMTLRGADKLTTLEGNEQLIARGPVAALASIKNLGSVGGGFYAANSAHPLDNPGPLSNVLQGISVLVLPAACVVMFGRMLKRWREAAVLGGVMLVMLAVMLAVAVPAEAQPNRALSGLPVDQSTGNLEGKELRFGPEAGPTHAVVTTAVSCGSVNCMHDSLSPQAGLTCLVGMWLGCVFGGLGSGLLTMLLYVLIAVFLAGLMVGRTPEYLGRKIEAREMKLAMLALLAHPLLILGPSALFVGMGWTSASASNPGPHALTQTVYEFTSASSGNGSGFEGLDDTCGFADAAQHAWVWDVACGLVILLGRFVPLITVIGLAASLGRKVPTPQTAGTLRTDTLTFAAMLLAIVMLFGALLYLPVAALGPIAEHLAPSWQ